jgi:hypothetical protein
MDDQVILVAGCVVSFLFLGGAYGVLIGFFRDTNDSEFKQNPKD